MQGDSSLATELADMLVGKDVPFREAHEAVGGLVRWCEEQGRAISTLDREEAARFHPGLAVDLAPLLDPRAAVERKTSRGGTAWTEIERQLEQLRRMLGADS